MMAANASLCFYHLDIFFFLLSISTLLLTALLSTIWHLLRIMFHPLFTTSHIGSVCYLRKARVRHAETMWRAAARRCGPYRITSWCGRYRIMPRGHSACKL